jgi:hypothetical protein
MSVCLSRPPSRRSPSLTAYRLGSFIDHNRFSISVAIAGEVRSVLWMQTKLYDYQYFATIRTTFVSTNSDDIRSSYPSHNIVASVSWLFGMP